MATYIAALYEVLASYQDLQKQADARGDRKAVAFWERDCKRIELKIRIAQDQLANA